MLEPQAVKVALKLRAIAFSSEGNKRPQVAHEPHAAFPSPICRAAPRTQTALGCFAKSVKSWSANLKRISHVRGFICWQKIQRRAHPSLFLLGLHCRKLPISISRLLLALPFSCLDFCIFPLKPKILASQYYIQDMKTKDLFLIKANKMMSTLKLSSKPYGLILFLIKTATSFQLRKKKWDIHS